MSVGCFDVPVTQVCLLGFEGSGFSREGIAVRGVFFDYLARGRCRGVHGMNGVEIAVFDDDLAVRVESEEKPAGAWRDLPGGEGEDHRVTEARCDGSVAFDNLPDEIEFADGG